MNRMESTKLPKKPQDSLNVIDSVAIEVTRDINLESSKLTNQAAKWEHEDLAKVRIKVFRGHTDAVNNCQFFAEESRVLSSSADGSIKIWDPRHGKELHSLDNAHTVNAAAAHCTEDGSRLVSCGWDKVLQSWDLEKGESIWSVQLKDMLTCCQLSSDGRLVCVGSDLLRDLHVYDLVSGEVVQHLKGYHNGSVTSCHFTPNNERVITTSEDRTCKFFDLHSEACTVKLKGHDNVISSCAMTQDERKLATASWDKSIQIWDISTGMYRSKGPSTLKHSHDGSVLACDFAKDGLQLVTGSADLSIVVWDVENNIQKLKLQGHAGWVTDVHFSQDQSWLLSCAKDSTVRMWNIEDTDQIPLVMENRRAGGLRVAKCSNCGKPFSISQLENFQSMSMCVFCRLLNPEQTWLSFKDDPDV